MMNNGNFTANKQKVDPEFLQIVSILGEQALMLHQMLTTAKEDIAREEERSRAKARGERAPTRREQDRKERELDQLEREQESDKAKRRRRERRG